MVKSIPYTNKPAEVTPGVANHYASTYYDGQNFVNVLVKTREGRPIFVKANNQTGVAAPNAGHRFGLGLYDSARLTGPQIDGSAAEWSAVDAEVAASLGKGVQRHFDQHRNGPSLKRAVSLVGWNTFNTMPSITVPSVRPPNSITALTPSRATSSKRPRPS